MTRQGLERGSPTTRSGPEDQASRTGNLLPSITTPSGGGAVRGIDEKYAVQPATGTATLSIPLGAPQGRPGLAIDLALAYDSGTGNGPFGIGWNLTTPRIARKTDKGIPRYADDDVFVLSGVDDLVPVGNPVPRDDYRVQRYRPRIESTFHRIERWTRADRDVHFRVTTRDNVLHIYGGDGSSRIADPDHPERVFAWLLQESRDDRGNLAAFTYRAEDGAGVDRARASEAQRFAPTSRFTATTQRYLKRIDYGNEQPGVAGQWHFTIVLDYGEHHATAPRPDDGGTWTLRPDPFSSYRSAFEVRTYRRCARVLVFHSFPELGTEPVLVRSTDLRYDDGPALSYLVGVTRRGYRGGEVGEFPELALGYRRAELRDVRSTIDRESLVGIEAGVGDRSLWVDLDGEGLPGVLIAQDRGWYYKRNLGDGRLGPPVLQRALPSPAELAGGAMVFDDVDGDGNLELVRHAGPVAGYFARGTDASWGDFRAFAQVPHLDWTSRNLRMFDIDGDGFADLVVTEDDAFAIHHCLARDGFAAAVRVPKSDDEDAGPAVVFADASETIFLADMTGDGLIDIARIRAGEVCYWPSLGHGRFGRKVTLEWSRVAGRANAFDDPCSFDPRRIRLADVDGTGTSDIVYLGADGADVYLNQAGNALAAPVRIASVPPAHTLARVSVVDLLGRGTACIVWTSPAPGAREAPLHFVDLLGGRKPHLLESIANGLGAETHIDYVASTEHYIADRAAGRPWLTRLAFPVQVVARVEHVDRLSRSTLVTTYAYHHGFYDGEEREFRGFARVDQRDAEAFGDDGPPDPTSDPATVLRRPPVRTTSWFHTGAWLGHRTLEAALADEYWRDDPLVPQLAPTPALPGRTAREERESTRALRGLLLRREVYAEDGTAAAAQPYTVAQRSYEVVQVVAGGDRPGVYLSHPSASVECNYERVAGDPRCVHHVVLRVDDFGNPLEQAAIAYGRRAPDPDLPKTFADAQGATLVTYQLDRYTIAIDDARAYRLPMPAESRTYELIGATVGAESLRDQFARATAIDFATPPTPCALERRRIAHHRTIYRADSLAHGLLLGTAESRGVELEKYQLAFTPGLLAATYRRGGAPLLADPAAAAADAGYRQRGDLVAEGVFPPEDPDDVDGDWWIPSGRVYFTEATAAPATEFAAAVAGFFLPRRAEDAFGGKTFARYAYDLVANEVEDAVGNVTHADLDLRALAPALVTDPNGNHTAIAFDALGLVTAIAIQGKDASEGDRLDGFSTAAADVAAFLADPSAHAATLIGNATTRFVYDLSAFRDGRGPASAATIARELHASDPSGAATRLQIRFQYRDGFGRDLQATANAEPGPLGERWVTSGWVILNNKGNPVRRYEPFFSPDHRFRFARTAGVSATLLYDPIGRVIGTLFPDRSYEKVRFDAWREERWDRNDTIATAAGDDPDLGAWFALLPLGDRLPAWRDDHSAAAAQVDVHAATPTRLYGDALGRPILTVAHNRWLDAKHRLHEQRVPTFRELDVQGNERAVRDAKQATAGVPLAIRDQGRIAMRYTVDVAGRRIAETCQDAGEQWTLPDAAGQPRYRWDRRGHTHRFDYDAARRPTAVVVRGFDPTAPDREIVCTRTTYGEGQPDDTKHNLRTRVHEIRDAAGVVTHEHYDFEGRIAASVRQLAQEFRAPLDWSTSLPLEPDVYRSTFAHDALGRAIEIVKPDGSTLHPHYYVRGPLARLDVDGVVRVRSIDYDAKGQRLSLAYGNGVVTTYGYDDRTFRLTSLATVRAAPDRDLQNLAHTHDPVGNILSVHDAAQDRIFFDGDVIEAHAAYTYDALYQLRSATGREHEGLAATPESTWNDAGRSGLVHRNDGTKQRRYTEWYDYDDVGNLLALTHARNGTSWIRSYEYGRASRSDAGRTGNVLTRTVVGQRADAYTYDEHGNLASASHLPAIASDHLDHMTSSVLRVAAGAIETTYYVYDAGGERVRKVTESAAGTRIEERIYLGGLEIYRKYGTSPLERTTLHVLDGTRRIALIETRADVDQQPLVRYQLDNHLGSACVEVDDTPAADVISYEEYYPFGSTAYQGRRPKTVSAKRYRYIGKERDEETGFQYHSARYYAPWLGRWMSPDPKPTESTRYGYANANPVRLLDSDGAEPKDSIDRPFWDYRSSFWDNTHDLELAKGAAIQYLSIGYSASKSILGKVIYASPLAPAAITYHSWEAAYEFIQGLRAGKTARGIAREAVQEGVSEVAGSLPPVALYTSWKQREAAVASGNFVARGAADVNLVVSAFGVLDLALAGARLTPKIEINTTGSGPPLTFRFRSAVSPELGLSKADRSALGNYYEQLVAYIHEGAPKETHAYHSQTTAVIRSEVGTQVWSSRGSFHPGQLARILELGFEVWSGFGTSGRHAEPRGLLTARANVQLFGKVLVLATSWDICPWCAELATTGPMRLTPIPFDSKQK